MAYAGMDIEIKESGKFKGKAKLSKRGSGLLRQILYLAAIRSIHLAASSHPARDHAQASRLAQGGFRGAWCACELSLTFVRLAGGLTNSMAS